MKKNTTKRFANMTEVVQYALKIAERKRKEWKEKEQDESRKRNLPNTQSNSKRVTKR